MNLIVNMMVHNEAHFLEEVMTQLDKFVDGYVILDDESEDNPHHVIKEHFMPPFDKYIYWHHTDVIDYSERRNHMLGMVKDGSWILKWDPDEIPSTGMIEGLRDIIEGMEKTTPDVDGYFVPIFHIMKSPRTCLPMEFGFSHLRLFRKSYDTVFSGSIHEQVNCKRPVLIEWSKWGIAVIHLSYWCEARLHKKAEHYSKQPGSGFSSPQDLTSRLSWEAQTLPDEIQYNTSPGWMEKIREIT